jgi:hypothetical protein
VSSLPWGLVCLAVVLLWTVACSNPLCQPLIHNLLQTMLKRNGVPVRCALCGVLCDGLLWVAGLPVPSAQILRGIRE